MVVVLLVLVALVAVALIVACTRQQGAALAERETIPFDPVRPDPDPPPDEP